jgi:hypothetical protein
MKKGNNINSQTTQAFQLGGTVQLPGFTGTQITQPTTPTTGYRPYVEPVQAASSQFVPQFTGVQYTTATGTTNIPTFAETVGRNPGQYDELRTYVNDAGQTLRIPFKNGQPIYPIPYGYKYQAEEAVTPTDTATVPTTAVEQGDGSGDNGGLGVSGAVQGPAGGPTGVAGLTSAFSGLGSYLSGQPAEAQPYGSTTLSSLNAMGMVSRDAKGNVIGPAVTDFSNNIAGVKDAFGVYGSEPINLSTALSVMAGNIPGALASVRSRDSGVGMFGQAAPAGFGAFSTSQLEDYASGKLNPADAALVGIAMDKNQAFARAQVQRAIGTPITGLMGYKPGSISPITGTPVNQYGQVVNFTGSTTGVDPGFSSMGDWIDAMKAGMKSGYYGGFKNKAEVAMMTDKQRALYAAYATERGANPNGQNAGAGKAAEIGLGQEGGPVGATPGGTAKGTPGPTSGRADYSGGYQGFDEAEMSDMAEAEAQEADEASGGGGGYGSDSGGVGGAGDMGVICLTEDMKVKRNGVIDFVTNVKVGDIVDNTLVTEVLHKHMREGYYVVNGELKITNDHPVLANGSWKRTEDLVLGDYINSVEVTSLEYVEQITPTVYIGTADDRYDVYTEGEVYTVHGQYKNGVRKAA